MLRVVFDTVVFVRALINPYSVCGRLVFQHVMASQSVLSRPVVTEILEVFRRPELASKFRTLREMDLRRVLDIVAQAEIVEVDTVLEISRDPKDDKFLATAQAAEADYLVSQDNDLLVLGRYEGAQIVTCAGLLGVLEAE